MSTSTAVDARGAVARRIAEGLSIRLEEPPAVARARAAAAEAFSRATGPDRVRHLWRYTDPARFVPSEEALSALPHPAPSRGAGPAEIAADLEARVSSGELAGTVLTDGAGIWRASLRPELREQGVVLTDLATALRTRPDIAVPHLGKVIGGQVAADGQGRFEALNLGLWSTGTFLYIPRKVRVEKPVHLWLSLPREGVGGFLATRVLVVMEDESELSLVDECEGGAPDLIYNAVHELTAGQAARLRHVLVQRLGGSVRQHVVQRTSVARDANLLTATASLGGGMVKADLGSYLDGPGATVELFGFLCGEGRQQFDHHTVHDHRSGHTCSNLDFKVVLKDRAQSAYTGLIRIEKEAPECEAYQENRNLLLTAGTKAESVPELEILNDDVKCTHGATVGSLDPQHLFYLMCRGPERREAIRLIVGGFIEPTLSRLPEDLRERLRSHVETRLRDL